MDFYKKLRPAASERHLVNVGRVATVVMVSLALLWIPVMGRISSQLWIYLQSVQAYVAPPIAAVFLFGIAWKRVNGQGALASLLVGFVLGTARFILEVIYAGQPLEGWLGVFVGMNFLHFAVLMFVICVAVLVGVSLLTPAPAAAQLVGLTFQTVQDGSSNETMETATPSQRWLNWAFTLVLVVTMILLWVAFA
jgi:solute:Na+ symporter, SSS family